MSSEQPSSLREIFDLLCELPEDARAAWLDGNCPDADLRQRVERLLQARALTFDPLAVAPHQRLAALATPLPTAQLRQVAGFTLVRPVGQGGMATVYLAERSDFEQRVALKLLHRTILSDLDRKLFERERRVLASLEHPGIARLIDGGITETQQPYLVMEFIEGEPITDHARRFGLSPAARIALLIEVCEAVAVAHAQLIVHRDLKPSNVLVASNGRCKLLDFGVAKVLADETDLTGHGCAGFTPDYAAPEQRLGRAISTATDVYALGVMALELLIGSKRPELRSQRASQAALQPGDQPTLPITARSMARYLRGDLDNVLARCLDEDPQRRYQGAQALADDLRRFLAHQPVSAHPPSRWYLVRKFALRHRGGVILTALLSIATLASLVLALWLGGQAREQARLAQRAAEQANVERERAQAALLVSEQVQDFVIGMFDEAVPDVPQASEPTVKELVLGAEGRIENELAAAPEAAVEMYRRLVQIYAVMGADDDALRVSRQARLYAQAHFPPAAATRRIAEFSDAMLRVRQGDGTALAEMEAVLAQTPADDESAEVLAQRVSLGALLTQRNRVDDGLALLLGALPRVRSACAAGDSDACDLQVSAVNNLGVAYSSRRDYAQARVYGREALDLSRKRFGPEDRETAKALGNLGMIESYLGDSDNALQHTQQGIELLQTIEGPHSAGASALRQALANLLSASGHPLDALAVHERVLADTSDKPPGYPNIAVYRINYAKQLLLAGRYDDAQKQMVWLRPSLEADPQLNASNLARLHEVQAVIAAERDHDAVAALASAQAAIAVRRAQQPVRSMELAFTLVIAHRAATLNGPTPQTEAWLEELHMLIDEQPQILPQLRRSWYLRQAEVAIAARQFDQAAVLLQQLETDIGTAAGSSFSDWIALRRRQLAAAQGQSATPDDAWLSDLQTRWGETAPIVREARALVP